MDLTNFRCEKCGNAINIHAGQKLVDGRLFWSLSYNCNKCGNNMEVDGVDSTPEDVRNMILVAEGRWVLTIEDATNMAAEILKILKQVLNLSMSDVAKLKKSIPGDIANGTKTEMLRLKLLLQKSGFSPSIRRDG